MLYKTSHYALVFENRPYQVDFYEKSKKKNSLLFGSSLREIQIVNKHFQVYAMSSQIYLYKSWSELHDRLKTSENDRGVFACSSFKGDDDRFMIATLSEKNRCGIQITDYVFGKSLEIPQVFGEVNEKEL